MKPSRKLAIKSVRPLVRYVDEGQAVIDVHVNLASSGQREQTKPKVPERHPIEVVIRMTDVQGNVHDHRTTLQPYGRAGVVRFEMGTPRRWWPAGMGEQALYDLTILVIEQDRAIDTWQQTIGLTSVRPADADDHLELLVNGHERSIVNLVEVHPHDEHNVLPAGGDCLLVVRGHFGPDVLYSAADRAGVLVLQAVPLTKLNDPDPQVRREVDRLASHPCLAGWYVDHAGEMADHIADRLHRLDPTRCVFRQVPNVG